MKSYFEHDHAQIERLLREWKSYGRLIVAFDYDNTVYDYHEKGLNFDNVIEQLQKLGSMGCEMICFTSCDESRFDGIKSYLKNNGIMCHGINKDSDRVPFKGRKIYYNVFYDDRAGLGQVVRIMNTVIHQHSVWVHHLLSNNVENYGDMEKQQGEICAISGKPLNNGEWRFHNGAPMIWRNEKDFVLSDETRDYKAGEVLPIFEDFYKYYI